MTKIDEARSQENVVVNLFTQYRRFRHWHAWEEEVYMMAQRAAGDAFSLVEGSPPASLPSFIPLAEKAQWCQEILEAQEDTLHEALLARNSAYYQHREGLIKLLRLCQEAADEARGNCLPLQAAHWETTAAKYYSKLVSEET